MYIYIYIYIYICLYQSRRSNRDTTYSWSGPCERARARPGTTKYSCFCEAVWIQLRNKKSTVFCQVVRIRSDENPGSRNMGTSLSPGESSTA